MTFRLSNSLIQAAAVHVSTPNNRTVHASVTRGASRAVFSIAMAIVAMFGTVASAWSTSSLHYAGYYYTPVPQQTISSVQAEWTVPTVTYAPYQGAGTSEATSIWIGIGGITTSDLIQTGTSQAINSAGATTYEAWYEMLPAQQQPLDPATYPVFPGDEMDADIACFSGDDPCTIWEIYISDVTQKWVYDETYAYPSSTSTADWIVEAPYISPPSTAIYPLPNYGSVTFQDPFVNTNTVKLSLAANGIYMRLVGSGACSQIVGCSTPCPPELTPFGTAAVLVVDYGQSCTTLPVPAQTHTYGNRSSAAIWGEDGSFDPDDYSGWSLNESTQAWQQTALGAVPNTWSMIGQRDFTGGGNTDILWRDTSGDLSMWLMNGFTVSSGAGLGNVPTNWTVLGTGDLNSDGKGDILWRDTAGDVAIWFMNGATVASTASLGNVPTSWTVVADDNKGDIFWHDNSGNYVVWKVNGGTISSTASLGNVPLATWQMAGIGDFNGDGITDVLWRDSSGDIAIWFLTSSMTIQSTAIVGNVPASWSIAQTGDYNGDGMSDILWIDTGGDVAVWYMNGGTITSTAGLGNVGTTWVIQAQNSE